MEDRATVKAKQQRTIDVLRRRGASGTSTNRVTVRLRYGEPVEIEGMDCKISGSSLQVAGNLQTAA